MSRHQRTRDLDSQAQRRAAGCCRNPTRPACSNICIVATSECLEAALGLANAGGSGVQVFRNRPTLHENNSWEIKKSEPPAVAGAIAAIARRAGTVLAVCSLTGLPADRNPPRPKWISPQIDDESTWPGRS